jgi:ribulose kinase
MVLSNTAHFVPGLWGPYYGAVLPEMFLNEAGQSAAGSVLKMVLDLKPEAAAEISAFLDRFENESDSLELHNLVKDVHVWPDYHGNRSPLADPLMKGGIIGLKLDLSSNEFQPTLYLAHVFALAYGTKYIVETMQHHGHKPLNMVYACGGLAKNSLYIQAHADVLNVPVVVPNCDESVALGSAMLAAVAAKVYPTLSEAMAALGQPGSIVYPRTELGPFHERKYSIFRQFGDFLARCN